MKKTLVLGVSTAIIMTTLTGCVFDRPVTTKYGIDPPDSYQNIDSQATDTTDTNEDPNIVPVVYGPPLE